MCKVLRLPDNTIEYELHNSEVEVLILNKELERLDIQYAPSLKKIISLSEYVIFGPKEAKAGIPILNKTPQLNEIITFGYIQFNTKVYKKTCAWTGVELEKEPPILTTVGHEYISKFPCYYYDPTMPIDDPKLIDAYPVIRGCDKKSSDLIIKSAFDEPNIASAPVFTRR